jgi:uncharacterized protein (TIGR03000 family)
MVGYAYPGPETSLGNTMVMPWGPLSGNVMPAGPYLKDGSHVAPATGTTGSVPGTSGGTGSKSGAGSATPGGPGGISAPTPFASLPKDRGQIVVLAPADAKLFAEGQATTLTGTQRVFSTPELTPGRDFQYTLKVESPAGTETKQVVVRAGHRTVVDFTGPAIEKAASPVTVNLPAKAKLFVDGVPASTTGGNLSFRTPELTKGKAFTYEFRAEVEKAEGKTEVQTRSVTFHAGEPVSVDFTETVGLAAK